MTLARNQIESVLSQFTAILPRIGEQRAIAAVVAACRAQGADSVSLAELQEAGAADIATELERLFSGRTVDKNPVSRIHSYCDRLAANIAKCGVEISSYEESKLLPHQLAGIDECRKENLSPKPPHIAVDDQGYIKPVFRYMAICSEKGRFEFEYLP